MYRNCHFLLWYFHFHELEQYDFLYLLNTFFGPDSLEMGILLSYPPRSNLVSTANHRYGQIKVHKKPTVPQKHFFPLQSKMPPQKVPPPNYFYIQGVSIW